MVKYAYEYGKRWNAQLPRNDIRLLVSRYHVLVPHEEIAKQIETICIKSKIPKRMIPACRRYAFIVHENNRDLYHKVVRGGF